MTRLDYLNRAKRCYEAGNEYLRWYWMLRAGLVEPKSARKLPEWAAWGQRHHASEGAAYFGDAGGPLR